MEVVPTSYIPEFVEVLKPQFLSQDSPMIKPFPNALVSRSNLEGVYTPYKAFQKILEQTTYNGEFLRLSDHLED